MIKVVLIADCGTVPDSKAVHAFSVTEAQWDTYTDDSSLWDDLSDYAWDFAVENARFYGFEPESHRELYDNQEDYQFTDDISGYFEVYEPELHDNLFEGSKPIEFINF